MSIFSLSNGIITLTVKHKGAEITSIKNAAGTEFMWQPQGSIYWQRQSPLLFPVVGKLKENQYYVNGVRYPMNQHGFVRDMEFDFIGKTANQLIYWIKDNTETQKQYPFLFELRVIYTLIENKVSIRYLVKNIDTIPMYFTLGGHPAFKCPIKEGDIFQDYYLEFEKNETVNRHFLEGGLIGNRVENFLDNTSKIPLHIDLFREDAIVLKDLQSRKISLKSAKHNNSITIHFDDFPYVGIWTQPGAPFICLEPWKGLADTISPTGDIKDKPGIITLEPQKKYECEYFIEVN
ncbi:MAG: aldose 1-epimerase family protein [Bacteroidia bacterium]|nr:aldose 1-epimerase family protein [Bacteroidia bacterium]